MARTINPILILLILLLGATTLGLFVSRQTTQPLKQVTKPMMIPPLCVNPDRLGDDISRHIQAEAKAKVVEQAAKTEAQLRQERIESQLVQMQAVCNQMKAQWEADRAALREQSLQLQATVERNLLEQQALATGHARCWLDSTGHYTCVANLDVDTNTPSPQTVVLRTVDDRRLVVSVDKLCKADREHIQSLYKAKEKEIQADSWEAVAEELDLPHKQPKVACHPRSRIPVQAERPAIVWEKIDWPESFRTYPYLEYTDRIDDLVSRKAKRSSIYAAVDELKGAILDHIHDHSPQDYVSMKQFTDDVRRGAYPEMEQVVEN